MKRPCLTTAAAGRLALLVVNPGAGGLPPPPPPPQEARHSAAKAGSQGLHLRRKGRVKKVHMRAEIRYWGRVVKPCAPDERTRGLQLDRPEPGKLDRRMADASRPDQHFGHRF